MERAFILGKDESETFNFYSDSLLSIHHTNIVGNNSNIILKL